MSSLVSSATQRVSRQANWAEFYKNGVPAEVIILDDDDEPEDELDRDPRVPSYHQSNSPDLSKNPISSYQHDFNNHDTRPAGKRRRMSLNGGVSISSTSLQSSSSGTYYSNLTHTPTIHLPQYGSSTQMPPHRHGPLNSRTTTTYISTNLLSPPPPPPPSAVPKSATFGTLLAPIDANIQRNHSKHVPSVSLSGGSSGINPIAFSSHIPSRTCAVAPTIASFSSAPLAPAITYGPLSSVTLSSQNQPPVPLVDPIAGQKRKRVVRHPVADESKKKELETALAHYRPPPKPPIRAKDVYVPVVRDKSTGPKESIDDKDGHFIVTPDTLLTDRYKIVRVLGQGTFGKVVEAIDLRSKTQCAVKVIRAVQKYRDASRIELRVLSTLASNDETNSNKCIHLRDCFDFRNHICIVTSLYGQSVFDFLKGNGFVPFPGSHIQKFAHQLLTSVAFLHDLNLIHTDLKPENILLVDHAYQTFTYNRPIPSSSTTVNRTSRNRKVLLSPEIRLIDFGSATFDDEFHSSVVSTRHYRAPEIILELGWSYACDMWSIACILVEFYTGDALFQTHDNLEHLAMMEPVCNGPIDADLVRTALRPTRANSSSQISEYFRSHSRLNYPNSTTSKTSRHYVNAMKRLHEFIPPTTSFNRQFLDLLRRLFVYNPKKRLTAKQALQHPWFREVLVDDGTEAERIKERNPTTDTRR